MQVESIAECSLQNAPREHSAILSTCIKLQSVLKTFLLPFVSGRSRQVKLYIAGLLVIIDMGLYLFSYFVYVNSECFMVYFDPVMH